MRAPPSPPASPTAVARLSTVAPVVLVWAVCRAGAPIEAQDRDVVVASVPSTSAGYVSPVAAIVTSMSVAPSTTWWLVTMMPLLSMTMPVPAASPAPKSTVVETSAGRWTAPRSRPRCPGRLSTCGRTATPGTAAGRTSTGRTASTTSTGPGGDHPRPAVGRRQCCRRWYERRPPRRAPRRQSPAGEQERPPRCSPTRVEQGGAFAIGTCSSRWRGAGASGGCASGPPG